MSDSDKPGSAITLHPLSDHSDEPPNKPDFRQLHLGSPVSPLPVRPAVSSSSSSSGSASGRVPGRTGHGRARSLPLAAPTVDNINSSGELSVESPPTGSRKSGPARSGSHSHSRSHSRSGSGSGSSSATSPAGNVLPTGNICPSGKVVKTIMSGNRNSKPDVLSLGTGNYGHGSIIRGGASPKSAVSGGTAGEKSSAGEKCTAGEKCVAGEKTISPNKNSSNSSNLSNSRRSLTDPHDLKKLGNEQYKKGNFVEALSYYDRAVSLKPGNASYLCNRSAALVCLNRLTDAVKDCEEAVKLNSGYVRAHHRLGSLLVRLGQVEPAREHLCLPDSQPDPNELAKLEAVEEHVNKCTDLRRVRDWNGVLRECEAAIASGADSCSPLFACKSEALLKLKQPSEADLNLSNAPKFEAACSPSYAQTKFFGMLSEAYILFVRAQIDMTLGRFEEAASSIEKAGQMDPRNMEVAVLCQNVKSVSRARARGNDLFKSERLIEACSAYSEGLRLDPLNPVLFCNRATCWFKLGQFEKSLDDCNQALQTHPNYTKALLRRAATFSKLDRWDESVEDYEILRKELPNNNDIADSLFHAQVALKKSRGEDVNNTKFSGTVEPITSLAQFKIAVASPGATVVLYIMSPDLQCKLIIPFFDILCSRYPSLNFLKVDLEESAEIANAENVLVVPTVKIYRKGNRVKEMVCPSPEALESSLRHYSLKEPDRLGLTRTLDYGYSI